MQQIPEHQTPVPANSWNAGLGRRLLVAAAALAGVCGATVGAVSASASSTLVPFHTASAATASAKPPVSRTAVAPAAATASSHRLAGWRFYVNPYSGAAHQAQVFAAQGQTKDAALMQKMAAQPGSVWLTGPGNEASVRGTLQTAGAAGEATVVVLYDIPGRDCGDYSAGGAANAAAYQQMVTKLAADIGSRRAVVVVEPDAIPMTVAGCLQGKPAARNARWAMLAKAVTTLKRQPNTRVYLDAGSAGWVLNPAQLVAPLRAAGIAKADGFSLNVSSFETTARTTAYGSRLSKLLGGKHFVFDTSRNGNGPLASDKTGPTWCNPAGRALGAPPTTATGNALVDAWLWIKTPGASDGSCRPGEPAAGQWWPSYAVGLAERARW